MKQSINIHALTVVFSLFHLYKNNSTEWIFSSKLLEQFKSISVQACVAVMQYRVSSHSHQRFFKSSTSHKCIYSNINFWVLWDLLRLLRILARGTFCCVDCALFFADLSIDTHYCPCVIFPAIFSSSLPLGIFPSNIYLPCIFPGRDGSPHWCCQFPDAEDMPK